MCVCVISTKLNECECVWHDIIRKNLGDNTIIKSDIKNLVYPVFFIACCRKNVRLCIRKYVLKKFKVFKTCLSKDVKGLLIWAFYGMSLDQQTNDK